MSMDHVRVHYNSPKPTQLNAHAFAQGANIHLAPGQARNLAAIHAGHFVPLAGAPSSWQWTAHAIHSHGKWHLKEPSQITGPTANTVAGVEFPLWDRAAPLLAACRA